MTFPTPEIAGSCNKFRNFWCYDRNETKWNEMNLPLRSNGERTRALEEEEEEKDDDNDDDDDDDDDDDNDNDDHYDDNNKIKNWEIIEAFQWSQVFVRNKKL